MTIYTYWVMKLDDKWKLFNDEISEWIDKISKLSLKAIFDIIFLLVYTLLLIALFLAFMVRWIALWFYIMFSPVFWLLYYFWKWKDGVWQWITKNFNLHDFISLAFVPVYVAWALTFWLIFLHTAGKWFSSQWAKVDSLVKIEWNTLKVWNNTFTAGPIKTVGDIGKEIKGGALFGWFTWPIWAMILEMLGLAVLWVAVMATLKRSKVTANITSPISEFWDQIGRLISKAPTYAPILPWWISAQWLSQIWSMPQQAMNRKVSQQIEPFQDKINKVFWVNTIPIWEQTEMNNILNSARWIDTTEELNRVRTMYNNWVSKYWRNDPIVRKFEEKISKAHIDKSLYSVIETTWAKVGNIGDLSKDDFFTFMAWDSNKWKILKGALLPNMYTPWTTPAWSSTSWTPPTWSFTPWNWIQIININTKDPWKSVNINLNLKDWKIQWVSDIKDLFKDWKWVYKKDEFKKLLKDKWIIDSEIDDIIKKLWDSFFKS